MSMSVRALPKALAEKARLELNEDPKRLSDDLQHLKYWIAEQPHLRARTGHWKEKVQEYSSLLEEEIQFTTDESRHLGKPKTAEEMSDAEGSYRKLEVD